MSDLREKLEDVAIKCYNMGLHSKGEPAVRQATLTWAFEEFQFLNLVQLDNNQELPKNKMVCNMQVVGEPKITRQVLNEIEREIAIWGEAQQVMLRDNFKRVKL